MKARASTPFLANTYSAAKPFIFNETSQLVWTFLVAIDCDSATDDFPWPFIFVAFSPLDLCAFKRFCMWQRKRLDQSNSLVKSDWAKSYRGSVRVKVFRQLEQLQVKI